MLRSTLCRLPNDGAEIGIGMSLLLVSILAETALVPVQAMNTDQQLHLLCRENPHSLIHGKVLGQYGMIRNERVVEESDSETGTIDCPRLLPRLLRCLHGMVLKGRGREKGKNLSALVPPVYLPGTAFLTSRRDYRLDQDVMIWTLMTGGTERTGLRSDHH
ncbi:hypothetical protein DFS33DRAFT_868852 [Desarmillaria ectypa]|nr:hypothetical protein DFS33DRAFT_868852 [Desarmillaria ectypa]